RIVVNFCCCRLLTPSFDRSHIFCPNVRLAPFGVVLVVILLLVVLAQDDQQPDENGNEVDEERDRVHWVVDVSLGCLLDDELRVKHNEAHKHEQAAVQLEVHDCRGAEEQVCDGQPKRNGEHRSQNTTQVHVTSALRKQRCKGKATEDHHRAHERCHDN